MFFKRRKMKENLSTLAGLLTLGAFIPYILGILSKENVPSKATWIIWASLDTITLAGMYAKGTLNGQIISAGFGGWITVAFALKYGESGWTKRDKLCLSGAVLGIILWLIFNDPVIGIVTSLSVIFLGSIPTFTSVWKDPSRENKLAWLLFWSAGGCATLSISEWTLAKAAQPVTFFLIESIILAIIIGKPRLMLRARNISV